MSLLSDHIPMSRALTCMLPQLTTVAVHPRYFRPTEVDLLLGNPAKAKRELGWAPTRNIDDIIAEMIANDMKMMKNGRVERRESQVGL
jgi:GDPmannose 4,6-dehydratase